MKEVVIDSSVFVSSFIGKESCSEESRSFFEWAGKEHWTLVIPLSGFLEILHAIFRTTQDAEFKEYAFQTLITLSERKSLRVVPLEAAFSGAFLRFHEKLALKTVDCMMAVLAADERLPLVSWDRQLVKSSQALVEAYTPTQFLALHGSER